MQVSVRIRPLNERELNDESTEVPWQYSSTQIREKSLGGSRTFTLDAVLKPETTNEECYDRVAKTLVRKAMEGFNATVFAYGQTGSGKTWSMLGDGRGLDGNNKGIIPRALLDVFAYVEESKDREFLLRVSYLEVYNENINDLLGSSNARNGSEEEEQVQWQNLRIIKDDPVRGAVIENLAEAIVRSPEEALELIAEGDRARHVAGTNECSILTLPYSLSSDY